MPISLRKTDPFPKPTKDFKDAGFNEFMTKQDSMIDWKAVAITKQNMMSEDTRSLNLINDRSLRIFKIGTVVLDTVSFDFITGEYRGTATVEHSLGYIPTFMAFYQDNGGTVFQPIPDFQFFFGGGGYEGFMAFNAHATSKIVSFDVYTSPGLVLPVVPDTPFEIKYYIFRERIDE